MFVPLSEYHGGGAAATIEPLNQHMDHYRLMLLCNLAMGVQACYRGPRLFDTPETRDVVRDCVTWFKEHREILESDLIHGKRADGRDLDWVLHVNPKSTTKGMLVVFNPLNERVQKELCVGLYYPGLRDQAILKGVSGGTQRVALSRDYRAKVPVDVAAGGVVWVAIE